MRRSRIRSRKNPRAANPCRKKKPSRRRIGARPRGTEPSRRARRPVRTSRRSPIVHIVETHCWSRAAPRPRREAARSRRRPRRARCARRARTAQTQTPPRSARIQTPCDTRASTVSCAARAPKAASSVRRYNKQLDRGRAASRSRAAPRRRTGTSANAAASPPRRRARRRARRASRRRSRRARARPRFDPVPNPVARGTWRASRRRVSPRTTRRFFYSRRVKRRRRAELFFFPPSSPERFFARSLPRASTRPRLEPARKRRANERRTNSGRAARRRASRATTRARGSARRRAGTRRGARRRTRARASPTPTRKTRSGVFSFLLRKRRTGRRPTLARARPRRGRRRVRRRRRERGSAARAPPRARGAWCRCGVSGCALGPGPPRAPPDATTARARACRGARFPRHRDPPEAYRQNPSARAGADAGGWAWRNERARLEVAAAFGRSRPETRAMTHAEALPRVTRPASRRAQSREAGRRVVAAFFFFCGPPS